MILFVASMLVAVSVAGTLTNGIQRLSGSLGDQSIDVSENIRTDIEIISDPKSGVYNTSNNENVSVLVKNTGSQALDPSSRAVDVLVDGRYATNVSVTVVDGSSWRPGNVVEIEIDRTLAAGDHRVLVIANGDREVLEFRT